MGINIMSFSSRVISLTEYRKSLVDYLHKRMASVAPNLAALIGDVVGARLISHAGSLTNLAKYPASTVQILGAEKALFRALKKRGNTPKYGLIFHSSFIGRAAAKNKGRISRFLANKATIACRVDCFTEDEPNPTIGNVLKSQVEERLIFFETGQVPEKNVDVMARAVAEVNAIKAAKKAAKKAKKDKKKKRKIEEMEKEKSLEAEKQEEASGEKESKIEEPTSEEPEKKKKKKSKKSKEQV